MISSEFVLDPSLEEWFTSSRKESFLAKFESCFKFLDDSNLIRSVISQFIRNECCLEIPDKDNELAWSRNLWGHRLDQLYLENKVNLDQVAYKLLRVTNQGLAFELYHQLVAKESTFEQLSINYGEGQERFHGGLFNLQDVEKLANGISFLLLKLQVGELSKPVKMNEKFGILQLTQFVPAKRDEYMQKRLLERQFNLWVNEMTDQLYAHLRSFL